MKKAFLKGNLEKKLKFLAFVDVHGGIHEIKSINEKALKEKADGLICAGDLTFFGNNPEELAKRFNSNFPLFIIPGNHELPEDIENLSKKSKFVKNIHGRALVLDSCMIFGVGGSKITPFSTPFEMDDMEIWKKLNKLKRKKGKLILVTHEPPLNTALDNIEGIHLGSNAIRRFIEKIQPEYCICGHFHENAGKEDRIGKTKIINPGPAGEIIEI